MSKLEKRAILKPFIKNGKVDYKKLKEDTKFLEKIEKIETTDISNYTRNEKFAFWLNAYNFITLKSVIDQIEKNSAWGGNLSYFSRIKFFFIKKHKVAQTRKSLHNIENKILRKEFNDARIHFAINCASIGCPALPNSTFQPETLEEDLEELALNFIQPPEVIFNAEENILHLSQIFKWYKRDFKPDLLSFLKKYIEISSENPKIEYNNYDWKNNNLE